MSSPSKTPIRGRCVSVDESEITVRNQLGLFTLDLRQKSPVQPGDIVEVVAGEARILTPNRSASRSSRWMQQILDPRRLHAVATRQRVEALIREYFVLQGFIEARTPLLVPSPGMEPHIRPFEVIRASGPETSSAPHRFLPTSPEFAMKRLLVGGLERIFQICPAFRDEPESNTHHPEFTMLEWYRSFAGYEDIMADTERLFEFIAKRIFGKPSIPYEGKEISVTTPWPRLRVRDLFLEFAGVDLVQSSQPEQLAFECKRLGLESSSTDTWDDLYFRIWLNLIEPKLPSDQAVFVCRYPASQAALSVIDQDPDGSRWARRFELYAGGLELGNAFEELTDPGEQRKRFLKDMELRTRVYGLEFPRSPLDEGFLGALEEGMPPAGGIAVGVDRMVMLFAGEPEIDYTLWLPSPEPVR